MILLNLLIASLMLHDPQGSADVCNCDTAKLHGGWCHPCSVGHFAGFTFASKQLADILDYHGHRVSVAGTKCTTCRGLIESGGYCEDCHMGFVSGKGYFSRLCYQIAKGTPVDPNAPPKLFCDKAAKKESGKDGAHSAKWCVTCKLGVVGSRAYTDKVEFEKTRRAVKIFKAAIAKSADCETCAVAMVADARCIGCKLTYQNGKPTAGPPKPAGKKPHSTDRPVIAPPNETKPPGREDNP